MGRIARFEVEVEVEDGKVAVDERSVPWRHFHAASGVTRDEVEGVAGCVVRGCGGVAPESEIEKVVGELADGGPAMLDPFFDEDDALRRIAESVPSAHVAERTVMDGTLVMS